MDVEECSSSCTWTDEALDHLETKTYELYDQRILENRNGDLDQKVFSAKGEEKV